MSYTPSHSESENEENRPLIQNNGTEARQREEASCQWIQARHVLALMAFIGFFNVYCLRVNLSMALVAMVNTSSTATNNDSISQCKPLYNTSSPSQNIGEFNWDEQTQGFILGAFFYGYVTTQVPGGFLAEKYGAKRIFGFGVLSTSVLTLFTPLAARWHLYAFYALRILEGIGEGVTFPAMHAMWGNWAPVWERSKLAGFSYSGSWLGTVVSMPISGVLCVSNILGGWPSVFYIFGAVSCVWVLAWFCLIHETPADHPRISKSEKEYIENSIGKRERLPTPWKKIFSSSALWGIAVVSFTNNWGSYVFLTCLPTFMQRILKFDIKSDGLLSALPYIAIWISQMMSGFIADYLRTHNYLSTVGTRRLMTSLGELLPAVGVIGVSYVGCDHIWAVILLTVAFGTNGFGMGGFNINHLDIEPKFAGVMLGITNGIASIPGFLAPAVVGYITNNRETVESWSYVFYLTAGIYVFGALVYLVLARGDEMAWARERPLHISSVNENSSNIQTNRQTWPPPQQDVHIPPPPDYTET
ncbi:LOW QUALITY PROTEIN: sialin-like [Haliotis rubra]|uniref:LOW QUALITY PROTEIN: sialin-like n=1 Tax=Haliotis rubra TaxID=36100 RepID=UPI001EE562CE|nr:LOW QUALITY PROTEIN: sialin-like [Haliotis rubra]